VAPITASEERKSVVSRVMFVGWTVVDVGRETDLTGVTALENERVVLCNVHKRRDQVQSRGFFGESAGGTAVFTAWEGGSDLERMGSVRWTALRIGGCRPFLIERNTCPEARGAR
jgi:hypothetical protein